MGWGWDVGYSSLIAIPPELREGSLRASLLDLCHSQCPALASAFPAL